jgi:hypothetical protein
MAVHVDEIHTDVVPAASPPSSSAQESGPKALGAAEEAWREAQRYAVMIARRTTAEGFDD